MKNQIDMLELINTIVNVIDTLIILIPAIVLYIYHKCHIINIYILDKSNAGVIIGIHNISSKTLIFSECNLIINKKNEYPRIITLTEINNDKFIKIKSDDIYKINIDYSIMNINIMKSLKIKLVRNQKKITRKIV